MRIPTRGLAGLGVSLTLLAPPLIAEPPDGAVLWATRIALGDPPGSAHAGATSVATQPDGRIVLAGFVETGPQIDSPAIVRLLPDGTPDPAFGVDGIVTNPVPGETERMEPAAVALEPGTGRILVVGLERLPASEFRGFVLRLLPDGAPDPSFDGDGVRRILFGLSAPESTTLSAVDVAGDGTVMVAGGTVADVGLRFAVARLTASGELDSSFDGDGLATFDFAGGYGVATALVRLPGGGALVAGTASPVTTATDAVVARLLADGTLDTTFGVGGRAAVDWALTGSSSDRASSLAVDSRGRIVIGGSACSHDSPQGFCEATTWALARLLPEGSPDPAFGTDGKVHGPLCVPPGCPFYLPAVDALAVGGDDRPLFAGLSYREPDLELDFGVVRLDVGGAVDSGFGALGLASVDFSATGDPRDDWSQALALAADGRILVAGQSGGASSDLQFAAALLADALVFADGFDTGSTSRWTDSSL